MRAKAVQLADRARRPARRRAAERRRVDDRGRALLRWLADGHFTFLGYREYDLVHGAAGWRCAPCPAPGWASCGTTRPSSTSFAALPPEVRARAQDPHRLIVTKANSRSTVHRPSYLDYVGGQADGRRPAQVDRRVPVPRPVHARGLHREHHQHPGAAAQAGRACWRRAGLAADSHDGKDLAEILEVYPREELFQIIRGRAGRVAAGVLRLRERRRPGCSCAGTSTAGTCPAWSTCPGTGTPPQVRLRVQEILRRGLRRRRRWTTARWSASRRWPGCTSWCGPSRGQPLPDVDTAELEARLAAAAAVLGRRPGRRGARAAAARRTAGRCSASARRPIPETYKTDVPASAAASRPGQDPAAAGVGRGRRVRAVGVRGLRRRGARSRTRPAGAGPARVWRLTIYRTGSPDHADRRAAPAAAHGRRRGRRAPVRVRPAGRAVLDLRLRAAPQRGRRRSAAAARRRARSRTCSRARWPRCGAATIEDDGFNALVLDAHLTWRQVVMLRAYAKYLRQAGTTFSQDYIERVLRSNTTVTRLLVRLFESRFDPDRQAGGRPSAARPSPRRSAASWTRSPAWTRTGSCAPTGPDPGHAADQLLQPRRTAGRVAVPGGQAGRGPGARPARAAAAVRAVRLLAPVRGRAPPVRRRRPRRAALVGPPRGLPHRDPRPGQGPGGEELGHRAVRRQGRLRLQAAARPGRPRGLPGRGAGLLPDVHQRHAGRHRQPDGGHVVGRRPAWSGTTPTTRTWWSRRTRARPRSPTPPTRSPPATGSGWATRSPPAAPRATTTRRWASPRAAPGSRSSSTSRPSASTLRPADFTVVGVGDMSGDVFGNGMLLSRHIKLVAAFDHRHVFLDPDPDPAASFAERQRLFALPRSSWADYDQALISAGGGVWPRVGQVGPDLAAGRARRSGCGDGVAALSPDELISAILARAGRPAVERRHRHLRQGHRPSRTPTWATGPTTRSGSTPPSCGPRSSARAATWA